MQFAAICPVELLQELTSELSHHLVLAQHLTNKRYFDFYKRQAERSDRTVILDNGAYEGKRLSNVHLLEACKQLQPQVVVLPDEPNHFERTQELSEEFADLLIRSGFEGEMMTVVHATPGSLDQFVKAYLKACSLGKWVGFSRLTPRYGLRGEDARLRRVQLANHLKTMGVWRWRHKHHALGMLDGDVEELTFLNNAGFRSVDSSSPVWRGLCGFKLDDKTWPNYEFELESNFKLPPPSVRLAQDNLAKVLTACVKREAISENV